MTKIPAVTHIAASGATFDRKAQQHEAHGFTPLPPPSPGDVARFCISSAVMCERERQINGEGYQPETDDAYVEGELAQAAAAYALTAADIGGAHTFWPWHQHTFRPADPRRNLIKAAALIMAEIERLDRAAGKETGQ